MQVQRIQNNNYNLNFGNRGQIAGKAQTEEIEAAKKDDGITKSNKDASDDFVDNVDKIDYSSTHFGLGHVVISDAYFRDREGNKTETLIEGEKYSIVTEYQIKKEYDEYVFGVGIYTMDMKCVFGTNTLIDHKKITNDKDKGIISCEIDINLLSGLYILNVAIVDKNSTPLDFYRDYLHFKVISNDKSIGLVKMHRSWKEEWVEYERN